MSDYRINESAARVGRSVQTIRCWEREGKLTAKRLPSGHRYFDESDVRLLMGGTPNNFVDGTKAVFDGAHQPKATVCVALKAGRVRTV